MAFAQDGLANLTANLGTPRDKASASRYYFDELPYDQITAMYRGSWLPRKIVDIPADDAVRSWRAWQGDKEEITKAEAEEKRLGIRGKMHRALVLSRLYGGSAILIGTGEPEEALREPLDVSKIKPGGLKYATVLGRYDVTPGLIVQSAASEYFGKPEDYTITISNGVQVKVHPSRLCILNGNLKPEAGLATSDPWGDSVLQSTWEAIRNNDATIANVASLVFEAKVDVIKVPDLMAQLADGRDQDFLKRFALAATGKGINGSLILDANEEYEQKSASFGSLPDVIDRFIQIVCGAADIPATRLFGKSPGGMNSTGESDIRNYYDTINAMQTLDLDPAMANLNAALLASAGCPADMWAQWVPLWQMSAAEKADVAKTIAETGKILRESELMTPEAASMAITNALIETGVLPGIESAIDETDDIDGGGGIDEFAAAVDYAPRLIVDNDPLKDLADALERKLA